LSLNSKVIEKLKKYCTYFQQEQQNIGQIRKEQQISQKTYVQTKQVA
jgi:hypothetical protein